MSLPRSTIFALSSGRPPAAIAVVRISGPRAGEALRAFTGRLPEPRKAMLARLRDPDTRDVIDEALALWFPGPNSETGEDTVELQLHGGRAVIEATFAALSKLPDFRMAEAGEFTRRAFENGKLDLTRVEGLADLIAADSDAQRRQALRHLQGLLGDKAESWRKDLISALALVEAQIDFPDEGDVPPDLTSPALAAVRKLRDEIAEVLGQGDRGERLRDGIVVAIAGPPNAGKSSLLNRLARREAAIVSPFAGTTRDVIEIHLDLGGYPVVLLDTAGIRASDDPVEQEGIRRAEARAASADLVLWIVDGGEEVANINTVSLIPGQNSGAHQSAPCWIVQNKADLILINKSNNPESKSSKYDSNPISVSAKTGDGIPDLVSRLTSFAASFFGSTETALITRGRQRADLADTLAALDRALADALKSDDDLIAEELRLAARSLGRLTGRVDVEDVLDVIFRDFCIGK
jgi:tRNA modification GTPase